MRPNNNVRAQRIANAKRLFHPDFTVGLGIAPISALRLADLWLLAHYRQWGF